MANQRFYEATLDTQARLIVVPREDRPPQVLIDFGNYVLPVVNGHAVQRYLNEHEVQDTPYRIKLWPRTNPGGYIVNTTYLRLIRPLEEETEDENEDDGKESGAKPKQEAEGFHALGKLLYIDREEARFGLTILPNLKSSLKQPFRLHVNASLELLESLPQKGSGVRVWGELKPLSLRLMARRVEEVALPPTNWVENAAPKEQAASVSEP